MAQTLVLPISGLASDPGPYTAAPEGSLYEATNVVSRRAGVIEPRGGFHVRPSAGVMGLSFHTFRFAGSRFNVGNNSGSGYRFERDELTQLAPTGYSLTFTQGKTWSTVAQGRALVTTDKGVHVVDNATTTTTRLAGQSVPEGFGAFALVSGTAANNWLTVANYVAYRIVFVRYSDSSPVYSAPSNYTLVQNNQAGTGYVRLRICSTFLIDADEVHIYRSSSGASAPADEMYLRQVLKITTGGTYAPNTSFTWDDFVADANWDGPPLYTNETSQGIQSARFRPYYADDVATYRGMTFYAGHKSPHRVTLNMQRFGTLVGGADHSKAFLSRTDLCTTTAGSAVVATGFDPSTSYFVGQVVTLPFASGGRPGAADATFQADSRITAIGPGNQFTMSQTALTTGGVGFVGWDWIACERGGTRQVIYAMADASATFANTTTTNRFLVTDDTAANGALGGAQEAARAWSEGYVGTSNQAFRMYWSGDRDTNVTLTFEALMPSDAAFTVKSTKPLAFDRYCDSSTGITSTQDGGTHRLAFSPVDIPEATPLAQYKDVVPEGESIYRIVPARDSLWVFTSAGLYRLTGTEPESISIVPFDTSVILAQRQLVAAAHDALWAWTYRGILRITDGGDERIDLPIARLTDGVGSTLSNPWCLASHDHAFVFFGATAYGTYDWTGFCYSVKTGTWSQWSGDSGYQITSAAEGDDGELLVGWRRLDSGGSYVEGGTAYYSFLDYDVDASGASIPASFDGRPKSTTWVTVNTVSGTSVTIAGGSTYTPKVGDAVWYNNLTPYWITAVTSATQFAVHATGLGTGAVAILESFPVSVKWVARAEGNVGTDKFWTQATLPMERIRFGTTMDFSYSGVDPQQTSTETITYETGTTYSTAKPYIFRRLVPTSVARGWAIRVGFGQQWAGAFFSTAGLHLTYRSLRVKAGGG